MIASLLILLAQIAIRDEGTHVCRAEYVSFVGANVTASCPAGVATITVPNPASLAANGTNCAAGHYPLGVDAAGNAESCTADGGGGGGTPHELMGATHTDTMSHSPVAIGSLIHGTVGELWAPLLGNTDAFPKVLMQTGDGVASDDPEWALIDLGAGSGLGGYEGVLPIESGGTGLGAAGTANRVIVSTASNTTAWKLLTDCDGASSAVTYDTGTQAWGCNTISGGGTPASTVESEETLGVADAVGTDTEYARQDHTHGSPTEATIEAALELQDLQGAVTDAQVPNTITVDLASAATALAANPTDCAANQFATTIAASGNLTCAAIADADVPNTITVNLAAAATALAADGANCAAGQYPLGVDASGAVQNCTVAGGGSAHNLLSATHTDTVASAVVAGDLIFGNLTPAWEALPIGTPGDILRVSATSVPEWVAPTVDAPVAAEYIVSEANGTLSAEVAPSGANQVPVSSSSTAAAWGTVPIAAGGTGQTTAAAAFAALGGPALISSGAAPASGAANTAAAPSETWLINTANNAVTTVETVMSVTSVPIGTYLFEFHVIWRSGAVGTGTSFAVDYTGTVTRIRAARQYHTTGAAAATGVSDGVSAVLTGTLVEHMSTNADNGALGPTTGVAATTEDQYDIITGIMVVSTSANLNLTMTGEANGAVTFMADSTLLLKRLN